MKTIQTQAWARAALAGNPSDGYFGRTLAVCVRDFSARVMVQSAPQLSIQPDAVAQYADLKTLARDINANGYYGAQRLILASLKRFHDYASSQNLDLPHETFAISYETTIPRGVGLAGSSALVLATWRALMAWFDVEISRDVLPNLLLQTERDELGIGAGLQDRVAQVYEGLTFMDFKRELLERDGVGAYEALDVQLLPPLFLAFSTDAEPSERVHNDLRARWNAGDASVHAVMHELADLATQARNSLLHHRADELGAIMDANFSARKRIMQLRATHARMCEIAQECGASAHFAGSGGAIIGTFPNETVYADLERELGALGCRVLKPTL